MLFITQLLSEAGLLKSQQTDHSIACISTTRPIYLVFGYTSDHPVYVVRKLDDSHALQTKHVHSTLYQLVGNLVPEPIGIYEYAGETYDVQRGVKGAPWFQIKSKIHSKREQAHLEKRMWRTLDSFQLAIYNKTEAKTIHPHEELNKAYLEYRATSTSVNHELERVVGVASNDLSQGQDCPSIPQHGDFCLNNMIIDNDRITVIDFEDFRITEMPMYDHFTLALSLPSSPTKPANVADIFKQHNLIEKAAKLGIPESALRWHFLHHLLLRLGPWSVDHKRRPYRAWLFQVLYCFITEQKKELRD